VAFDAELPAREGAAVEAWLGAVLARAAPLGFADIRKGVRALSSLYVEGRGRGELAARAVEGPARRAALASYYAVLHFASAWAVARRLPPGALGAPARLLDLGCGTGATGAGVARALGGAPRLIGLDRSGWALSEARRTWLAFGLTGRVRRAVLPAALPRMGAGDLVVAGFVLNELDEGGRDTLLGALAQAARRGAHLLVLEPLSGRVSPWWEEATARLTAEGVAAARLKGPFARPEWIARMDAASGLDHRALGARSLYGPCTSTSPSSVRASFRSTRASRKPVL
jgi:SAM-dependent methyltransferase